ncbi:hypothetical protein VULLAG_LOCUS15371 [Vulpes lagopus]
MHEETRLFSGVQLLGGLRNRHQQRQPLGAEHPEGGAFLHPHEQRALDSRMKDRRSPWGEPGSPEVAEGSTKMRGPPTEQLG